MNTPTNARAHLITATVVPDHRRSRFWSQHFGRVPQWPILEAHVFGWLDRLCADYHGGSWSFYTLSNGGGFMAPEGDERWSLLFLPLAGIRTVSPRQSRHFRPD